MAHIKLKVLLEQIEEATIHPLKAELHEIRNIILRFLDDREKTKRNAFTRLGGELRDFYYALKTGNRASLFLGIDENLNELNHRLTAHRITFTTWMFDDYKGSISKDGRVRINAHLAFDNISKVNGVWDVDDLMTTIGHELIHREQYLRGMDKAQYSQRGDGGEEAYLNNPAEVMTWAYNVIKVILYKNPNITLPEVIKYLQTNEDVAEFLNQYTRTNRQKIIKHMIEYAKKLLDEK